MCSAQQVTRSLTVASSGFLQPCQECCSQVTGTQFLCSSCNNVTGYAYIRGGQCILMPGCTNLGLDGVCLGCANSYYLSNGQCFQCQASCSSCVDGNYCNGCAGGYYNATTGNYPLCLTCPAGCATCTSATTCQTCLASFRLSGSTCVACPASCTMCPSGTCTQCAAGFALIAGTCYACTDGTKGGSAGCTGCTSNNVAVVCVVCSSGYFLTNSNTCASCSATFANSLSCTSTGPTQCQNDYVTPISNRYHLVGSSCIANTRNCKFMNTDGTCSSCYFENGLYYTLSGTGNCVLCSITGCDNSKLDKAQGCVCQSCLPGYRFVNNLCIACSNLRCTACPDNPNNCTACQDTYGIFSSACAQCNLANCLNCDGDVTKCTKCADGYYLSNSNCYACQASCLKCKTNTQCLTCNALSYLQSNGLCKQLPQNCVQVYANGQCKLCQPGYYPIEGSCYTCQYNSYNVPLSLV